VATHAGAAGHLRRLGGAHRVVPLVEGGLPLGGDRGLDDEHRGAGHRRSPQGRRSRRTAQTLYSGILDCGSAAEFVRKLAAESDSRTNGMKIAPARTASVTSA